MVNVKSKFVFEMKGCFIQECKFETSSFLKNRSYKAHQCFSTTQYNLVPSVIFLKIAFLPNFCPLYNEKMRWGRAYN